MIAAAVTLQSEQANYRIQVYKMRLQARSVARAGLVYGRAMVRERGWSAGRVYRSPDLGGHQSFELRVLDGGRLRCTGKSAHQTCTLESEK